MRNILLTEEQIKYIINQSVVSEDTNTINQSSIDSLKKSMIKRIKDDVNLNNELAKTAQIVGVNPNYNNTDRNNMRRNLGNNFNTTLKDEIKWGAKILSNYAGKHGLFDNKRMAQEQQQNYAKLIHIKEFLDSKGLNWLYDINVVPDEKRYFGYAKDAKTIDDRINSFDLSNIGKASDYINKADLENSGFFDEEKTLMQQEAEVKMKASLLDNYMAKTYGLDVDLPKNVFARGNQKLPEDTLIINFTAALQCPAWNECLLREACYARRGEKIHSIVRDANVKRNLMWEAGRVDEALMEMIAQLMRLYSINYTKAIPIIKQKTGKTYTVNKLSKLKFSEIGDENILNILKENAVIKHIRLNENGDFIGQWLLDAVDGIAGDFKVVGILTSAYTCRNINMDYSKVANIILNVSNKAIKGNNVSRYFFAVDETTYDAFDETYGGENGELINSSEGIRPNPQPLYKVDNNGNIYATGEMYYKCPCERKDENGGKINCYNCNICYEANNVSNRPYYVLVKVHSHGEKRVAGTHTSKEGIPEFGFSKNFLRNRGMQQQYRMVSEDILKENISSKMRTGVLAVARNCVNSLREHLAGLAGEQEEIKILPIFLPENLYI